MECADLSWNSGDTVSVKNTLNDDKNINRVDEDNFQCTFFRQSKRKSLPTNNVQPSLNEKSISFYLSDTCTDSESELDESRKTPLCIETFHTNPVNLNLNNEFLKSHNKLVTLPKVTFDQNLYIHLDNPKFSTKKRSMRKEDEKYFTKVVRLKKKNCLKEKTDMKNKKCHTTNMKTAYTSRFPKKHNNQITAKNEMFLQQFTINNNNNSYSDKKRSILRGTKRTYDSMYMIKDDTTITSKKKKSIENRIMKNKLLLKSVQDIIREMNLQEAQQKAYKKKLAMKAHNIKPENKIAEIDLTKLTREEAEIKKPKKVMNNYGIKIEVMKPIFKKPEVEKLLNESMHEAIKKYRSCTHSWEESWKKQFRNV